MKVKLLVGLLVVTALAHTVMLVAQEPASGGESDRDRWYQPNPGSNRPAIPLPPQTSRDHRGVYDPRPFRLGNGGFPQTTPNPTVQAQVAFAAATTEEERIAAKEKLEEALSKEFDVDIARREAELEKIRNQLAKLAESLQKRIDAKSKIVALRAQVLTAESEGLEWRSSSPVREGDSRLVYPGTASPAQADPFFDAQPAGPNPYGIVPPAVDSPAAYGPVPQGQVFQFENPALPREKE